MNLLAGLNKVALFSIVVIVVITSNVYSGIHKQICMGDNYVLTNVTPTIQTIAVYSKAYESKTSIIRGKIEFMAVESRYIAGYLSIRFFVDDELTNLSGKYDKEGFFIINKYNGDVISGIDGLLYFKLMKERYNITNINFFKPEQAVEFAKCQH